MRQPCHPEEVTQFVCLGVESEQDMNQDESYASCLTEDLQLFGQLADLEVDSDELLSATKVDFDLVELVSGLQEQEQKQKQIHSKPKSKRAAPTKRQLRCICDVCERCFSDAYSLRIHKMTHTDEKPHVCNICGKGFRQQNKLRIHSVTHTDKRPHECDICGKGFRFANYLAVHRRLHTGEKPYMCTVRSCSISFHSIHARRMHVKLQHASTTKGDDQRGEEHEENVTDKLNATTKVVQASLSYTCPICARVLTDQCYLNTHLKRHYNQRDFACPHPECGKRFFSSSELNHHQIAHTRLRPFRCALCMSSFLRKSNYKQHLKLHKND